MSEPQSDASALLAGVTVTYRLSDYFIAMARRWRSWVVAFVLLATFVILLPVLFDLLDGCTLSCAWASLDWRRSGLLFLFVLAWFFLAPVLSFLLAKRRGDLVPITFTLIEEGVQLKSASGRHILHWSAIQRPARTRSGLLFVMRSRPIGIPRRAFDSEARFQKFSATADEHWKAHHRL